MSGIAYRWTDDIRDQVIEMSKTQSLTEIAKHFGANLPAFQKAVRNWRLQGYKISSKVYPLLQEVRTIKIKGESIQRIYTEKGWVFYHRYIWEQANGPIPENYCIIFKDGNKMNCDLSNLEMVMVGSYVANNSTPKKEKAKKAATTIKAKKPGMPKGARTANRDKPGCKGNWVHAWENDKDVKVKEPPPMSEGIRIDSRTIVFPKNKDAVTKEQLAAKYGNRVEKLKEGSKEYAFK